MIKPEVSHPTECCPEPELWNCYDSEATECEVLDFLFAFVTMLKPKTVIETGCYNGFGTQRLVQGASFAGRGHVWTTDISEDKVKSTRKKIHQYTELVDVLHGTGLELIQKFDDGEIDFAFLDSGPDEVRCHELRALFPKLSSSGVVMIHDSGLQHGLRPHLINTLKELSLQFIMLDTPRGVTIARKPWPDAR